MEFLGDAVLDYLVTRYLYEDERIHSSGAIQEFRSALVNNSVFASLAVKHGFHQYLNICSDHLKSSIDNYVCFESNKESYYASWDLAESITEGVEDIDPPKILSDVFESVAGAIYLDSERRLDCVWKVYNKMIEIALVKSGEKIPKSPIAELWEMFPQKVVFQKPERIGQDKKKGIKGRFRVCVEVKGVGAYKGIGNDEKTARCTAAKFALHSIKNTPHELQEKMQNCIDRDSNRNLASTSKGNYICFYND